MYNGDKEFIKELSTLLYKNFERPDGLLSQIGTVMGSQTNGDVAGIFKQGSWVDSVAGGCEPEFAEREIVNTKPWVIGNNFVTAKWCYDQLEKEIARGEKIYELSSVEAFEKYATEYLEKATSESIFARGLFGSLSASTVYPSVSAALDTNDGLFTNAINAITNGDADASQYAQIGTNTKAYLRTNKNAIEAMFGLIDAVPDEVKADPNFYILINKGFADDIAYCARMNNFVNVSEQWETLFGGLQIGQFDGYKVVVAPAIDKVLSKLASGDRFYGNRAIGFASTTDNIAFGSIQDEALGFSTKIWDDDNTQTTKGLTKFSIGNIIVDDKAFGLTY